MPRQIRWLTVVLLASTVLFGSWWVFGLLGLASAVATGLAGSVTAIVLAPLAYWASKHAPAANLARDSAGRSLATRRASFFWALLTCALGLAVGVVVTLFAGSATSYLIWIGPGGPYPRTSLPPVTRSGAGATTEPVVVHLTDRKMLPESDSVYTGPNSIGRERFTRAVYAPTGCSRATSVTYQLDRQSTRFSSRVGPSSESRTGNSVIFTFYLDSTSVTSTQVNTGESKLIEFPVRDALRLTITWHDGGTGKCSTGDETTAVVGDPQVIE